MSACPLLPQQVMLTHEPAGGRARPGAALAEKDVDDRRPLDLALLTQQWPAVRLLIAAGALGKCPEARAAALLSPLALLTWHADMDLFSKAGLALLHRVRIVGWPACTSMVQCLWAPCKV